MPIAAILHLLMHLTHPPSRAYAQPPPAKNLAYQPGADGEKLDIYYPKSTRAPYKPVMLIHGGCFIAGSKDSADVHDEADRLLALGYAVVTVNYRLAVPNEGDPRKGINLYPAALEDVEDALCWIQENGAHYDLDTRNIVAMGYSAGGTLAGYLATGHRSGHARAPKCKTQVSATIDFFGRADFLKTLEAYKKPDGFDCGEYFVGERRNESNPQPEFHDADIVSHTDPRTAAPTLIVHGGADGAVNVRHSQELCSKLGSKCELKILPDADHMLEYGDQMDRAFVEVARFLQEHDPPSSLGETGLAKFTY